MAKISIHWSDKDLEKAQQFSQRLGSPRRLDEESVNVFVDAWWIFYENQGGITLVADFLNKKRREKGFVGDLNFNKQSGGQLQDVCPANAEAVNGQSPAKRSHARDSGPETSPPRKRRWSSSPPNNKGGQAGNGNVSYNSIISRGVEPAALPVTTNAIGEGAAIQQRPHVVSSDLRPHLPQPYSVGPLRQMSSVLDTHEEAPPMPNWIMDDIDIEQTGDLNAADPSIPDNAPPTTGQSAPKPCLQIKPPLWAVVSGR
ncbi:hypothetical protein IMY05_C4398001100 [Salix suchowensis]|nr:hypothetical protein IMY05_C4398001100 [Salix suchowensis]